MSTNYEPLLIALPVDFGPPIYYSPEEEFTLLLSQLLTAILAGIEDLDNDQILFALRELKNFINSKWDRKAVYSGAGSVIILPTKFRNNGRFIGKIREIFSKLGISIKIKFWDEFGEQYNLVIFSMDILLRKNEGINKFVLEHKDKIKLWDKKANEYFQIGLILTEKTKFHDDRYSRRETISTHRLK